MIGIVTGLHAEGRCLPPTPEWEVLCGGADPARARRAAQTLIERGVRGLISFGLAGGLADHLRSGDLVLPDAVVLRDGARVATDEPWRAGLATPLWASGSRVHAGLLAGSDRIVASAAEKHHLRGITGALAVDMESHAVAACAAQAGVPFVVVRAIADPADQALPPLARLGLGPEGQVRALPVAVALLRRPLELWPLLRLARQSGRAIAALRRVALLAGPALGLA